MQYLEHEFFHQIAVVKIGFDPFTLQIILAQQANDLHGFALVEGACGLFVIFNKIRANAKIAGKGLRRFI